MNSVPDPFPDTALEMKLQQSSVKSAHLLGFSSLHTCILRAVPWRPPCGFVQHVKVRDPRILIRLNSLRECGKQQLLWEGKPGEWVTRKDERKNEVWPVTPLWSHFS